MIRKLLLLLLVCTTSAGAVTIVSPPAKGPLDQVTLTAFQAATGLGTLGLDTRNGFRSFCMSVTNGAGTATVSLAQACPNTNFGDVVGQNSAIPTVTGGQSTITFCVQSPQCSYTVDVVACTGCSITAIGQVGAKVP